jgi:hypothetical protein
MKTQISIRNWRTSSSSVIEEVSFSIEKTETYLYQVVWHNKTFYITARDLPEAVKLFLRKQLPLFTSTQEERNKKTCTQKTIQASSQN